MTAEPPDDDESTTSDDTQQSPETVTGAFFSLSIVSSHRVIIMYDVRDHRSESNGVDNMCVITPVLRYNARINRWLTTSAEDRLFVVICQCRVSKRSRHDGIRSLHGFFTRTVLQESSSLPSGLTLGFAMHLVLLSFTTL